jgi:hypothetical protein
MNKNTLKQPLLTFLAARIVMTVWSALVPALSSLPTNPEPALRPYLGYVILRRPLLPSQVRIGSATLGQGL